MGDTGHRNKAAGSPRKKSTPSRPPVGLEISLVGEFAKPPEWRTVAAEARARAEGLWHPSTEDFKRLAQAPNRIQPHIVDVVRVAKIGELVTALEGNQDEAGNFTSHFPPHSIKRVNIITHGDVGIISLRGKVKADGSVSFWRRDKFDPDQVQLADGNIDESVIQWLNSQPLGIEQRDKIKEMLAPGAEIWLFGCRIGGGKGDFAGTGISGVGLGHNLVQMLADTLQVKIVAFSESIWYWPKPGAAGTLQEMETSIGEHGDRGVGYYTDANLYLDKARTQRLGQHMKKEALPPFNFVPGKKLFQDLIPPPEDDQP